MHLDASAIIENNPLLTNIDGLANLESVAGDFDIVSNSALTNFNGLSSLEYVGKRFDIRGNHALTNVDGLINLEEVGRSFFIQQNSELISLAGLSGLESVGGDLRILSNSDLPNLDGLSNLNNVGFNLSIRLNHSLIDFCGLYNLFNSGSIGGTIGIDQNGANTVAVTPPLNLTVNADPDLCSATILEASIGTATPVGCLPEFIITHSEFPVGNVFPVGTTQIIWEVKDGAGNIATAIQTVTVVDNQVPVIICPGNLSFKCALDVPAPDVNTVTATDNCTPIVTHVGDVITNQTCANRFTLTRTYKATDLAGNSATCSQVITVFDDVPPQINGLSVSQTALWPPNHTMRDIVLTYTATDNCANTPTVSVTVSSNEPINGTADGDTDPDWEIVNDYHVRLRAERAGNGNGRVYTIIVTANDGCNPAVIQSKQVFVAHNITGPQSGASFKAGSTVSFAGVFQDKPGNTHTAKWLLDGTVASNGTVTEPSGNQNGKVTGIYKFNSPGVYKLQMNVTDQTGITSYANTNGDVDAIVVIYDPNGSYAYGGGWFPSVAGALASDPAATGKASYGFAVNYRNAAKPKGETQFEFKVGSFEFNALNFEYLSVAGAKAQFRGTGKIIGGQSGINFIMTVSDGALDGTGVDKIRMKIFRNNGQVIYDNQPGDSDADDPTTAVGNNSIIFIQNSQVPPAITQAKQINETVNQNSKLDIVAWPNPSAQHFSIQLKSNHLKSKIRIQIYDQQGRLIEKCENIFTGSTIQLGELYRPGIYYIRVSQGKHHNELKLVKL